MDQGGGDHPEAVKTALAELTEEVSRETVCILLTDAPPHHDHT